MQPIKQPIAFIVMGVSGVGKTSISVALSKSIDATYIEADTFHPAENIAAMESGIPLTDEMRVPWLKSLARAVEEKRKTGHVVVACSALKRSYRDLIRQYVSNTCIIYLCGKKDVIAERLGQRQDHFMPSSLLDSQFAILEEPTPDERSILIDVSGTQQQVIHRVKQAISDEVLTSITNV